MPPKKINKQLTYDEKKDIVDRISNLNSKKMLADLFAITYNEKKKYSTNSNGVFVDFGNISDETYIKIKKYFAENTQAKVEEQSPDTKYKPYTEDEFPENNDYGAKLKFSNKEKNFIHSHRDVSLSRTYRVRGSD